MTNTVEQLAVVEAQIAAIQPQANELLDQLQTTTRAEGKALKASAQWSVVEQWKTLLTQRAHLRDTVEIEQVVGDDD